MTRWPSTETGAYCGPPPVPADIWMRWNLDPVLLVALAVTAIGFFALRRQASSDERTAFAAAMAVLVVAFVSPFCALTVALFSARAGHHLMLVSAAAPLFAYALRLELPRGGVLIAALVGLHTVVFWLWHLPAAYAAALDDTAVYWLMQATLLGSAAMLWGAILRASFGVAIGALLASTVQMGLLGALLTFAARPLYEPHFATTTAFGLTPLADQQLAGLLMWVPGSLPFIIAAAMMVTRTLATAEDGR